MPVAEERKCSTLLEKKTKACAVVKRVEECPLCNPNLSHERERV